MGHPNELDYPLEIWAVKLHDNWVRDHFYSLQLWREPLYDLKPAGYQDLDEQPRQLPIDIPEGWFVAGGAALWLAGHINQLKDIDLFTCLSQEEAEQSLAFLSETYSEEDFQQLFPDHYRLYFKALPYQPQPKYLVSVTPNAVSYKKLGYGTGDSHKVQIILRLYRSPSEAVHGFDLDCVGMLYLPAGYQLKSQDQTSQPLIQGQL